MKKKLISFILTFIMSISGFIPALSVNAADAADADALLLNVSGQLNWEVQFQPDELEAAKDWIKTSKEVGEEWIQKELARTTDTYKIDLLQTGLAESASLDTDSFFSVQPDGAADMDVSLANFTLTWDNGVSVVTDENGYYTLENVSAGAHTVKITQDDFILSEETVTIQSDQDIQAAPGQADEQQMNGGSAITADITISRTSADLSASIEDMAASMADSALQSALPDNAPAIAPQSYRIGEFVGRLAVFSNGVIKGTGDGSAAVNFDSKGVTYVNDDPEDLRVTCQRNNMTLEDSAMFPLNGSDCSISIGLGALANHDKSLYRVYYNSLYCWYEANPGPVQQRYCNNDDYVWIYAEDGDKTDASGRKYKQGASKNGHINCSWFNGIGHTENMHLETPLFLTVSDDTWNPSYQSQDSQAIQVETNYNYWKVISSDSSWLRPDEFRVEYDEQNYRSLVLSVDENSSASPRTGIITVFTGGGTENFDPDEADPNCVKTITVTQPGSGLGVDVDPKFWDADYQAQSKEFTVTTSYDHWFAESSDTSWLTVSPSEYHQGDPIPIDTLTLHILQNNGSTERKAVVYVRT
ncbi:MAG: hypothetical protein LBT44_07440, partial [Clostridiales bacterium]|nr:hypothetical protein [Clostridiales bacterium]